MKKVIVLLSAVLVDIKSGFITKESSTTKSKIIRGKITSILTDLREANAELEIEKAEVVTQSDAGIKVTKDSISSLYSEIDTLKAEVIKQENNAEVIVKEYLVESEANNALLRGIENLLNG